MIRFKLQNRKDIIVYGIRQIRNELRETSTKVKIHGRKLRILLLELYDFLVRRELETTKLIKTLAREYFGEYRKQGGIRSWKELEVDFLTVASASVYNLDVIVSGDEASLKSLLAFKAYQSVNSRKRFTTPEFINYEKFKTWLTR